jgi:CHAT domain-containing protein
LDEAFSLYSQLSQQSHLASRMDIRAAESWITSAEQAKHGSALVAYQTMLKFMDQYVAVLAPSSNHFDVIKEVTSSIAMDAFSCCVRHGALANAVELIEQGRAVLWTQLARLRTPLDELSASGATGNTLAEEFKKLSLSLRDMFDASTKDQSPQIRQLTTQWDGVVSRIRQLPDFSRFLLPPLFSDLQKAAEYGPVIIVNGSKYSCDVLIITRDRDPILIPLDISLAEVSELSSEFQSLTKRVGSSDHRLESHKMVGILRKLWACIVSPVVQVLRELIDPGSRIWWCPTADFTLLPLHAAGPYEKRRHNLSHFYVSSYTSTLAALLRARHHVSQDTSIQQFVAVGQGHPDGGKELRHVATELNLVEKRVAPVLSFTSLAGIKATVQGASDAFSRAQWLHLACHGMPNRKQPFESSFAMRDGPFTIMDIIRSRLQNPEFAFLSACHTTVGDESSPDEAIHLAAAMQFSGFRSVIGSMWSVDDDVAREVVTAFYDNLVDGSGRLDCRRAAVALHDGMKTLRKKIPLEQQIVFVHIGI